MRGHFFRMTLALALLWWAAMGAARAESRHALVIGNSAYQSVSALPNPANDARAMAELLTAAGFEVETATDLAQADMRRAIAGFAGRVAAKGVDAVALVYYAGHGVQIDGENFLVPVDAQVAREADVPLQTVRLADLMNALAGVPSRTRIVILDACRNNPFSEINKVTGRGLAIVDAPNGSIVSYSTAPGSEAEDGAGANSPYTTALMAVARESGLPIEQAFKRVRYAVHEATDGRQTPWESSSLTADFAFFPGAAGAPGAAAAPPGPSPSTAARAKPPAPPAGETAAAPVGTRIGARSVDSWRKELQAKGQAEAYRIVIEEDEVEAYQAYIELFEAPPFRARVREVLERRRVMISWYVAVTVNTPASYRAFLAEFQGSDLALTAQRLMERAQTRAFTTETPPVQIAAPCVCPPAPAPVPAPTPGGTKRQRRAAPAVPPSEPPPVVVAPVPRVVAPPPVVRVPPRVVTPTPPPVTRPPPVVRIPPRIVTPTPPPVVRIPPRVVTPTPPVVRVPPLVRTRPPYEPSIKPPVRQPGQPLRVAPRGPSTFVPGVSGGGGLR